MTHENDIISSHQQEAAELSLELYNINFRRNEIEQRLNEISVILKTANHYETIMKQSDENQTGE